MATRGELRGRTRFFIDEPTQQNFSDTDINYALNVAQQQVQLEIVQANEDFFVSPTPTTINVTASNDVYALHSDSNGECDVLKIKRVEDAATGFSILPVDLNEKTILPGVYSPVVVGGSPLNFYLLGDNICFTPVPTQTQTLRYWYVPLLADMTDDNNRSQIPRALHDMIAVAAAIDCLTKDEADISQLVAKWNQYMDRLHRVVRNRQIVEPRRVRRSADVKDPTVRYPNNIW